MLRVPLNKKLIERKPSKKLKTKKIENVAESGFYVRGRYQIITLNPKPKWMPERVWLALRRKGLINDQIKSVSPVHENLIMLAQDVGLNLIMQHLSGDTSYPLEINFAAIGTGTTAPASDDTTLESTSVANIPRAIGELTDVDTYYTEWFITNDELPNGEYTEFGLFCGAQLFARSLIQSPTHTKADNEDTLIVYSITCANS